MNSSVQYIQSSVEKRFAINCWKTLDACSISRLIIRYVGRTHSIRYPTLTRQRKIAAKRIIERMFNHEEAKSFVERLLIPLLLQCYVVQTWASTLTTNTPWVSCEQDVYCRDRNVFVNIFTNILLIIRHIHPWDSSGKYRSSVPSMYLALLDQLNVDSGQRPNDR